MKDVSVHNFGYLIAFVLPGLVALHALALADSSVAVWLSTASARDQPTVGGFLYVTLASVGAGLAVSTVRWLVVDAVHHHTGIRPPVWDDTRLQHNLAAFEALVGAHYRFYQHYANTCVALTAVLGARVFAAPAAEPGRATVAIGVLLAVYWFGSRDSLTRYYRRAESVLGMPRPQPPRSRVHDQRSPSQARPSAVRIVQATRRRRTRKDQGSSVRRRH